MAHVPATPARTGGKLATVIARAHDFTDASRAENTKRAYRSDWRQFVRWCEMHGVPSLPSTPEIVAAYLASLADDGKKSSTLGRRAAAISYAHKLAQLDTPTKSLVVEECLRGIRRRIGSAQDGKRPAVTDDVVAMVETLPGDIRGVRDRAILLVGFAGAFRRSELVSLDVSDIEYCTDGLRIFVRKSKTDQEGKGRRVGIPFGSRAETCPVRALKTWLELAGILSGPIFRGISKHGKVLLERLSDRGVARTVKRAAEAAGLDPEEYSGHSLRAGLATAAAAAGVSERVIMAQTGHKSLETVRRYIREGTLFRENAAAQVGL